MTFKSPLAGKILDKRIPTLVGIGVLVIGLIAGMLVFSEGTGVFSPRATPSTTPKQVKLTNVSDSSFTISFLTDEATPGFVRYGTAANNIKSRTGDDRDQLTGGTQSYTLHHITVGGLQPGTTYYYLLGTGSGATFDNNGSPFTVTTARRGTVPAAAKTVFGSVTTETGAPADGAVVYIKTEGAGELSSLVKSSGSWAIPLSSARTTDGNNFAQITDTQSLAITVQGVRANQKVSLQSQVNQSQPVAAIRFGQEVATSPDTTQETEDSSSQSQSTTDTTSSSSSRANMLGDLVTDTATRVSEEDEGKYVATGSAVVSLDYDEHQTIETSQPVIAGTLPPGVEVSIEVNSQTQIRQQVTVGPDGKLQLNLAELEQELEPGEHTVKYSYTDPDTGQLVQKTHTFTVAASGDSRQLAQGPIVSPSPTPFGTGNPYPIGGAATSTQSATVSASPSPSATGSADKGGTTSARTTMPSTASGVPVSGSISATMSMVVGGLFFLVAAGWSFWISSELGRRA